MKYRAEIDGLRAVAVVPVILFHAGVSAFAGGFVGVDVFFVISGYLITTILISDLDKGRFSLVDFYERRARRILPALMFVVLCCLPAAWFLLAPKDMIDFAQSVVAVATFSANILFWLESGYFDTAAELKPLLHTWSLAVEEQFYIFFPLVLMAGWARSKRVLLWLLGATFCVSLLVAEWGAYAAPGSTFYLLPTRGWELLVGSFVAFYLHHRPRPEGTPLSNVLSFLGAALIVVAVFVYNKTTPFPGLYALPPTVGTALVILYASPGTWVHSLLTLRAFVAIGLVSYSAYLWHQPLLVFYRHWRFEEPQGMSLALLLGVTGALAWVSWRFIERPFRSGRTIGRGAIFAFSATALAGCIVIGLWASMQSGFAGRYPQLAQINFFRADWGAQARQFDCLLQGDGQTRHAADCFAATPDVALWGDSHAGALSTGLRDLVVAKGLGFTQLTQSGCPPLFDLPTLYHRKTCNAVNLSVLEALKARPHDVLILHAAWLHGDYPLSPEQLETRATQTLSLLQQTFPETRILVAGNVPRWGGDVERAIVRQDLHRGLENQVLAKARTYDAVDEGLGRVTEELGIEFLSAIDLLCRDTEDRGQICAIGQSDAAGALRAAYYIDNGHMSRPGALILAADIMETLFPDR